MKKLNLFLFVFSIFFSAKIFAQDAMTPPEPITIPIFESMKGSWVSESYQMMGTTMTDEVTQKMVYNSQFFSIEIRSVSSSGFIYEGMVLIAPAADGNLTGWAFDIFGKKGLMTYTGTWKDNMVYIYGTADWGTESRVININADGNVMSHNVIFKMKGSDGKMMPEQSIAISYNKKM